MLNIRTNSINFGKQYGSYSVLLLYYTKITGKYTMWCLYKSVIKICVIAQQAVTKTSISSNGTSYLYMNARDAANKIY